jgi:Putative transposase/Transposase zinc-binding domain
VTARPAFELADVFRRHGETYAQLNAGHLGRVERRVTAAIAACRTAALGGHVERCDDCGLTRIAYNSCRNRHCPKCQGAARVKWLAARQAELLPVPYFHVVFTLPSSAAEIAFQNKRTVYGLLMRAAAQALSVLAAKRLGARIGLIAVLHTWGQTLTHHPHVHCLVPGGGVALDNRRWVEAKPNFLLSVHALSKAFRRLFLDGLEAESEKGELSFFGELARLAEPEAFKARMRVLRQSPFVVYAKPPFGGPARVLAYLARYTHRTAIANSRLVAVDDNEVAFVYKDYRRGGRSRIMRLAPHEFIRRFLLHVLPDGLHRIRHYGFLAKGERGEKLAYVRDLLHVASKPQEQVDPEKAPCGDPEADAVRDAFMRCPDCGGFMRRIETVAPRPAGAFRCDTS